METLEDVLIPILRELEKARGHTLIRGVSKS